MKIAVVVFGRFNPPTVGHELLLKRASDVAKKEKGELIVFASPSQDPKRNPLSHTDKISFLRRLFPAHARHFVSKQLGDPFKALEWVYKTQRGVKRVVFVMGGDRLGSMGKRIAMYNGSLYKFDELDFANAGKRDPDADDVSGMSASKLRNLAVEGDFKAFAKGVPGNAALAQELYDAVRKAMKLEELAVPLSLMGGSLDNVLREDLYESCVPGGPASYAEYVTSMRQFYKT